MTNLIYGWFSSPTSRMPEHDPPHDAPCLFCGEAVFDTDVRTTSVLHSELSCFYRTHSTCHDRATEEERLKIDAVVLDMVARV